MPKSYSKILTAIQKQQSKFDFYTCTLIPSLCVKYGLNQNQCYQLLDPKYYDLLDSKEKNHLNDMDLKNLLLITSNGFYKYSLPENLEKTIPQLLYFGSIHSADKNTTIQKMCLKMAETLVNYQPALIFVELKHQLWKEKFVEGAYPELASYFEKLLKDHPLKPEKNIFITLINNHYQDLLNKFQAPVPESIIPLFYAWIYNIPIHSPELNIGELENILVARKFKKNEIFASFMLFEALDYESLSMEDKNKQPFENYMNEQILSFQKNTQNLSNWDNYWNTDKDPAIGAAAPYAKYQFFLEQSYKNINKKGQNKKTKRDYNLDVSENRLYIKEAFIRDPNSFLIKQPKSLFSKIRSEMHLIREEQIIQDIFHALIENKRLFINYGAIHALQQESGWRLFFKK